MNKLKAVVIKGNTKFIENNDLAINLYKEITNFLESLGYEVTEDPGEPYTSPPEADLWIGHSRGVDRLRFPQGNIKVLAIGSAIEGAINHPLDNTKDSIGESEVVPNEYHYVFTDDMKQAIINITNKIKKF